MIIQEYPDLVDLSIERYPNERISDHHSFYEQGYQTSYFLEYELNPYYHTSEDTIDKMNFSLLTKVCRLALATLADMAQITRTHHPADFHIRMTGSILSRPNQFEVSITNDHFSADSANVTISISLHNYFSDKIIPGPYGSMSQWNFSKDLQEEWVFELGSHMFHRPEVIRARVTMNGQGEDIGLYVNQQTVGIVGKTRILLVPRL